MKRYPKRLGELVLRTSNVPDLAKFYIEVIGLELHASFGNNRFLKVAEDFEGHPQMLAIFDKSKDFRGPANIHLDKSDASSGTLHHFAFTMEKVDFASEVTRLEGLGVDFEFEEYEQFGWRSIHFHDPDGNSIEFVCYDQSLQKTNMENKAAHTNSLHAE